MMNILRRVVGGGSAAAGTPVRAVWHETVLAESDETVVVDGNHYFPPGRLSLDGELKDRVAFWKGVRIESAA